MKVFQLSFIVWVFLALVVTPSVAYADCSKQFCVGIVVPLTQFGDFGTAFLNGVSTAQARSAKDRTPEKFIFEDSAYDGAVTLSAVNRLAKQSRVHAIYVLGGMPSEVTAPLADRLKIPVIVSSNEPDIAIRNPYIVRFSNPARLLGERLGQEVRMRGFKKTAVLITDNPYHESLLDTLRKDTADVVDYRVIHRSDGSDLEFRSIISKIKTERFDSIAAFLHPGQIRKFYLQLADQKAVLPTFAGDALESLTEVRASGAAIEGAFFVNHGVSDEFRSDYLKSFGTDDLISFAAWGHDLALILSTQFGNRPPPKTADDTLRQLSEPRSYEGATGTITFVSEESGDRYFRFPLKIREVVSGSIRNRD